MFFSTFFCQLNITYYLVDGLVLTSQPIYLLYLFGVLPNKLSAFLNSMFKHQKKRTIIAITLLYRSSISCHLITTQNERCLMFDLDKHHSGIFTILRTIFMKTKKKNTCCCCNRWGWPQHNFYQKQEEHLPLTSPTFSAIICEEGEGSHCSRRHGASKKWGKKAKKINGFLIL